MARPRRILAAPSRLPVAVRAYLPPPEPKPKPKPKRKRQQRQKRKQKRTRKQNAPPAPQPTWSQYVLVLDTETTMDPSQALLVGSYRFAEWRGKRLRIFEEGLFYPDALPQDDPAAFALLETYVQSHRAEVTRGMPPALELRPLSAFFREVFWPAAYDARAIVVGFNLPFDLSRLAFDVGEARGQSTAGGFSLAVAQRPNGKEDLDRPRIAIRHLDSRRSIMRFAGPARCTKVDKEDEKPYAGHFLELRTLAFALTDEAYDLSGACVAFGLPPLDKKVEHGTITPEYLDYNRRDVRRRAPGP